MRKIVCIFFVFYICLGFSQSDQKVFAKTFVKNGKIIFRILPKNKEIYNEITSKGMNLIRYEEINGVLSNSFVVNDLVHNYYEADTLNWLKLYRKDADKAGFVYSCLFPQKNKENLNQQDKLKLDKMTFAMLLLSCDLDKEVAKACGLFITDTSIDNSKRYTYKLSIYTSSLSTKYTELLSLKVNANEISVNAKLTDLKARNKNKIVTLTWNALNKSNEYSGYNVYRSEDSIHFQKVNSAPLILLKSQFEKNKQNIYCRDSLPEKRIKYYYYIKGINFFGEESEPSNVVAVFNSPVIRSFPIIDSIKVLNNRNVLLHWQMERVTENSLPEKYVVLKSNKDNGLYKTIFESENVYRYIDTEPYSSNYYKIAAIINNGQDTIYSFSRLALIIDTMAPKIVLNGKAVVDETGKLTLTWSKNKEGDLLGYKIFRSNRKQDEFVQVNTHYIKDTFYIEKLNLRTLSKKVYYKVVASDNNHNSSDFSEIIEVSRPDTIPPQEPIIVSVNQVKKCLTIKFIKSSSEDVSGHVLLKRIEGETSFEKVLVLNKKDTLNFLKDSLLEQGKRYSYKIVAIDEDGNESESKLIETLFETGFREKIKDVNYSVDRTAKKIELKWSYLEKDIEKFVIYRGKKNEPLTIVKSLKGENFSYIDKTIYIGNTYVYKIKATMKNGTESIISDPLFIEY